jgi:predicted glycosyltransferase
MTEPHHKRIWIDLANSPHVLFFAPLIERLRSCEHEVLLTARDFAQTVPLMREYGLEGEVIGGHTGSSKPVKAARMLGRTRRLMRFARGKGIDLAVSHNSYAQILAARLVGIPTVTCMDYEHQPANHLAFRLANRILVPAPFPASDLRRFGASPSKARRYSGLKEELYLAGFVPTPGFEETLREALVPRIPAEAWQAGTAIAVLRPPATFALYHGPANEVFDAALRHLARAVNTIVIVAPRTPEQEYHLFGQQIPKVHVLTQSVRGLDLLAFADLVVSAGGTMNREAALLGTPTYTVFAARLGAVDQWLIDHGRMVRIASRGEVRKIEARKAGDRLPIQANESLADEILEMILETV